MNFTTENLAGRPALVQRAFEIAGVAFKGRRGAELLALCPFHDDKTPSMRVNLDKAAYFCDPCGAGGDPVQFYARRNGTSNEDAIARLREGGIGDNGTGSSASTSTVPSPAVSAPTVAAVPATWSGPPPRVLSQTRHEIRDVDGVLIATHVRKDFSDGSKGFIWERNGKTGLNGLPTSELPLYASERLAKRPGEPVIVCEGEKATDALLDRGFLAVGTVTGAPSAPGLKPLEALRGRHVALWPDYDVPGLKQMERVNCTLHGLAASIVAVVVDREEKPGDDAADFFARGGDEERLALMLESAPDFGPPTEEDLQAATENATQSKACETDSGEPAIQAETLEPRIVAPIATQGSSTGNGWPILHPDALYGLAGDVVNTILPESASDPAALLFQFLTCFGNAVGRSPYFAVEADEHHANLYVVCVGDTGGGKKGTSFGQVKRLFLDADPNDWALDNIVGNLSSGEGLIHAVRDPIYKDLPDKGNPGSSKRECVDEGAKNKRLMVFEPEFAAPLKVGQRQGNTLPTTLRQAWETGHLRVMNKNSPETATDAHISIIGHITRSELIQNLDEIGVSSGSANRFLWPVVRKSKSLPRGGNLTDALLRPLYRRTEQALAVAHTITVVERDEEANRLWDEVYARLDTPTADMAGSICARGPAQTVRLSLIYALLDGSKVIRLPHLKAALAVWDYSAQSVRYLFADATGDPIADKILRGLREAGAAGMTGTEINRLFGGHTLAPRIEAAQLQLEKARRLRWEQLPKGGGRYFAI